MFEELSLNDGEEDGTIMDSSSSFVASTKELLLGPPRTHKAIQSPHWGMRKMFYRGTMFLVTFLVGTMAVNGLLEWGSNGYLRETMSVGELSSTASKQEWSVTSNVLFGISIPAGLLLCFFGYRLIKVTFFVAGFIAGAVILYDLSHNLFQHEEWLDIASGIAALIGGLLCGSLLVCLFSLAVILMGMLAGILFADFMYVAFLHRIYSPQPEIILYVAMGVFGVMFALFANYNEKHIVIIFTSWIGAYQTIRGVGFFIGSYPSSADLHSTILKFTPSGTVDIPLEYWIYFVATLLLFGVGLMIQVKLTAANIEWVFENGEDGEYDHSSTGKKYVGRHHVSSGRMIKRISHSGDSSHLG